MTGPRAYRDRPFGERRVGEDAGEHPDSTTGVEIAENPRPLHSGGKTRATRENMGAAADRFKA
jgi:hypothetical protein